MIGCRKWDASVCRMKALMWWTCPWMQDGTRLFRPTWITETGLEEYSELPNELCGRVPKAGTTEALMKCSVDFTGEGKAQCILLRMPRRDCEQVLLERCHDLKPTGMSLVENLSHCLADTVGEPFSKVKNILFGDKAVGKPEGYFFWPLLGLKKEQNRLQEYEHVLVK